MRMSWAVRTVKRALPRVTVARGSATGSFGRSAGAGGAMVSGAPAAARGAVTVVRTDELAGACEMAATAAPMKIAMTAAKWCNRLRTQVSPCFDYGGRLSLRGSGQWSVVSDQGTGEEISRDMLRT